MKAMTKEKPEGPSQSLGVIAGDINGMTGLILMFREFSKAGSMLFWYIAWWHFGRTA
jgi:hypothetical protein